MYPRTIVITIRTITEKVNLFNFLGERSKLLDHSVLITEFNSMKTTTKDNVEAAGGRALGAIISKIHSLKEFGIKTYEKLYSACVVPILDYCSSV